MGFREKLSVMIFLIIPEAPACQARPAGVAGELHFVRILLAHHRSCQTKPPEGSPLRRSLKNAGMI